MNWQEISMEPNLSLSFVKEHQSQLHWGEVQLHIALNKNLIQAFSKQLKWELVALNSSLTIELLEEIKDDPIVNWYAISRYYPVTIDMYIQFHGYLNCELLRINPYKKVEVERTETSGEGSITYKVSKKY